MGSIESTVSEMDDTQEQSELLSSMSAVPERNRRRRRRHTTGNTDLRTTNESLTNMDDPWWWEVENENLILDQVLVVSTSIENNENSNSNVSKFSNESEEPSKIDENTIHSTKSTCDKSNRTNDDQTDGFELNTNRSKTEVLEREFCSSKREQSLDDFKKELRMKRLERQNAVQDLRNEIASLKQELSNEKALTRRLKYNRDCEPTDNIVELPNGEDEACALSTPPVFDTDDEDPKSRGRHANIELANAQLALQLANSENISLRTELGVVQKQVCTLKEVIACCKQMLVVKEEQCSQLKSKLQDIEKSFADREMSMMSDNLRQEYERQLSNIRQLRQLYEERQRVAAAEYENLQRLISIKKDELLAEQEKTKNFEERNCSLIKEVELVNNELSALRDECNEHKFEKRALKDEMGAVNTLFSQMVMGFSGKNTLDIDRLTMMLEENRSLLSEIATKEMNISDGATLPKLLFELVEEAAVSCHDNHNSLTNLGDGCERIDLQNERMVVDGEPKIKANTKINDSSADNANENALEMNFVKIGAAAACSVNDQINIALQKQGDANTESKSSKPEVKIDVEQNKSVTMLNLYEPDILGQVVSTQEIIINLPKVWKVLIELLSHHKTEKTNFVNSGEWNDCDKSIETQSDPKTELSVSKTYIKLKDLILEKKSLVKETNRLKTLNSHLEYRLNEQEKRLSAVSLELTKTWHLVGKMQRQHRQLHTQEQILRYQLQQKRRLLTELKDELEYCRRKWATARAKNEETQQQWNDLRREFAKRKLDDANNSAESGFSDSGPVSDEEERGDQGFSPEPSGVVLVSSTSACSRRKHFKEMFEHTRKIKRMQSTSPGRAINSQTGIELVLRWNSAPPTCGWRRNNEKIGEREQNEDGRLEGGKDEEEITDLPPRLLAESSKGGAISKRHKIIVKSKTNDTSESDVHDGRENQLHHTNKIHKLEEQCKSLIRKVLETSDNRERLEIQLCRFEDEIAPVQYSVPLNEFINKKRLERMTRASSVPATGTLTPREEEYTRKRSERLERLEEESRQLLSRIKRTADRGNYLRSFLDSIRRGPNEPNHEDSYESNTEEELGKTKRSHEELNSVLFEKNYGIKEVPCTSQKLVEEETENLTNEEKAYTSRRAERLKRLERESKQLLESLTQNNQRSESLVNRLDSLHGRYSGIENNKPEVTNTIEQYSDKVIHPLHSEDNTMIPTLTSVDNTSEGEAIIPQTVVPTPKNVASSSIVDDELRDIVTVTTVPSQIAQSHLGAIPKSKVKSQLSVERTKSGGSALDGQKRNNLQSDSVKKETDESLEEMVKRLRALPFPNEDVTNKDQNYSNNETKNRKSE